MPLLDSLIRRGAAHLHGPERRDIARVLLVVDAVFSLANPIWSAFAERRHTGKWGPYLGLRTWVQGGRYLLARTLSPTQAVVNLSFGANVRTEAWMDDRPDWPTPGKCDACASTPCCKVKAPWGSMEPCPFLRGRSCGVYGGLIWVLGPCGRYPETPARIEEYGCPRFEYVSIHRLVRPRSSQEEKVSTATP